MSLSRTSLLLLLSLVALVSLGNATKCPDVQTVQGFDPVQYMGRWFEISTSKSSRETFEHNCFCTQAKYTLTDQGSVIVNNTCNKKSVDGPTQVVIGTAYPNPSDPAKLNVTFGSPIEGSYWVVVLDPDYTYAVVWSCSDVLFRPIEFMWILSRTPEVSTTVYKTLTQKAQEVTGYDVSTLIMTVQQGCPPMA